MCLESGEDIQTFGEKVKEKLTTLSEEGEGSFSATFAFLEDLLLYLSAERFTPLALLPIDDI